MRMPPARTLLAASTAPAYRASKEMELTAEVSSMMVDNVHTVHDTVVKLYYMYMHCTLCTILYMHVSVPCMYELIRCNSITRHVQYKVSWYIASTIFITFSGVSADINECSDDTLNNCHSDAICVNEVGNFSCVCRPGYRGNGVSCEGMCPKVTCACVTLTDLCCRYQRV